MILTKSKAVLQSGDGLAEWLVPMMKPETWRKEICCEPPIHPMPPPPAEFCILRRKTVAHQTDSFTVQK